MDSSPDRGAFSLGEAEATVSIDAKEEDTNRTQEGARIQARIFSSGRDNHLRDL